LELKRLSKGNHPNIYDTKSGLVARYIAIKELPRESKLEALKKWESHLPKSKIFKEKISVGN